MSSGTSALPGAIALLVSAGTMPRETEGLDELASRTMRAEPRASACDRSIVPSWSLAMDAALAVRAVLYVPWLTGEQARALQLARAAIDGGTIPSDALRRLERRAAAAYWGSRLGARADVERRELAWSHLFSGATWDVRLAYERAIDEPLARPDDALAVSHALAALRHAQTGDLAFHARRGIVPMASCAAARAVTLAARSAGPALWPDLVAYARARATAHASGAE